MSIILIGSSAAQLHISNWRNTTDWDIMCSVDVFNSLKEHPLCIKVLPRGDHYYHLVFQEGGVRTRFDVELILEGNSAEYLLEKCSEIDYEIPFLGSVLVSLPDRQYLAAIKRGHLYWPKNWMKHMMDYHKLRDFSKPWDSHFVKMRIKETEALRGPLKVPSLDKTAKDFFGQSSHKVNELYEHDDLHILMAQGHVPAYTLMQKEGEIKCEKSLWNEMSYQEKLNAVIEEAQVLALERILIPYHLEDDLNPAFHSSMAIPEYAFNWALMRICTNITSGWFRNFAINNWDAAREFHDKDYWDVFLSKRHLIKMKRLPKNDMSTLTG